MDNVPLGTILLKSNQLKMRSLKVVNVIKLKFLRKKLEVLEEEKEE